MIEYEQINKKKKDMVGSMVRFEILKELMLMK